MSRRRISSPFPLSALQPIKNNDPIQTLQTVAVSPAIDDLGNNWMRVSAWNTFVIMYPQNEFKRLEVLMSNPHYELAYSIVMGFINKFIRQFEIKRMTTNKKHNAKTIADYFKFNLFRYYPNLQPFADECFIKWMMACARIQGFQYMDDPDRSIVYYRLREEFYKIMMNIRCQGDPMWHTTARCILEAEIQDFNLMHQSRIQPKIEMEESPWKNLRLY